MPHSESKIAAGQSDSLEVPTQLFHTTLTVVEYSDYPDGETRAVYPLSTHANLEAAKAFASEALQKLGYDHSDFEKYEERSEHTEGDGNGDSSTWPDGVVVRAHRPGMHEFQIGIFTTPNTECLATEQDNPSEIQFPQAGGQLHYVLQTKIDYNADRSGAVQSTDIEGVYVHRVEALKAAKRCLIGDEVKRESFAEYDERDGESFKGEWPFGETVVIHAVSQTGENYEVAILTALRAHEIHGKMAVR